MTNPGSKLTKLVVVVTLFCATAQAEWIKAKIGPFEAVSPDGRASAIQALSPFEQLRFALGSVMGKTELTLSEPLQSVVFKDAAEMAAYGCAGIQMGRQYPMTCSVAGTSPLPAAVVRELTSRFLRDNFPGLPPATATALVTFLSTAQIAPTRATWGAPPAVAERTREWALLHRLITQPDYASRARIYLHNLGSGMDQNGALRSFGQDAKTFNAEIDRYYAAGVFTGGNAPTRPLAPDRDFSTTIQTASEGTLARADLLSPKSAAVYEELLKSGKQAAAGNEGLALLALRAGNNDKAREYMKAAREAGTKNPVLLTQYAALETDDKRAIEILKEALTADAKYAPAHWALGERIEDFGRRWAEWKQAVDLYGSNSEWWAKFAKLSMSMQQYGEAARAWVNAAQTAPDAKLREQYLAERGGIEQLRLDDEAKQKQLEAQQKAAEVAQLKAQAQRDLAAALAKTNAEIGKDKKDGAPIVDWDQLDSVALTGDLVQVTCDGKKQLLDVKDANGELQHAVMADPATVQFKGAKVVFACGVQKPRKITLHVKPAKDIGKPGDVTTIEFPK